MSARHPLTMRERVWPVAQLRTVRGRGVGPGDQVAVDAAAQSVAAIDLAPDGRLVDIATIAAAAAADLSAAVAAVERIVRARRREAATDGAGPWTVEALRRDERTLRLLRRVRNAALRAGREPVS